MTDQKQKQVEKEMSRKEGKDSYIKLGDGAIRKVSLIGQTQYLSRYTGFCRENDDSRTEPDLNEGLRFNYERANIGGNYHAIEIHEEDAEIFVRRVNSHITRHSSRERLKELVNEGFLFEPSKQCQREIEDGEGEENEKNE